MNQKWEKTLCLIIDDAKQINKLNCPNCGKQELDYLYIGEEDSRISHLQVWCTECKKGAYVSRVQAPPESKFISYDEDSELPIFEIE